MGLAGGPRVLVLALQRPQAALVGSHAIVSVLVGSVALRRAASPSVTVEGTPFAAALDHDPHLVAGRRALTAAEMSSGSRTGWSGDLHDQVALRAGRRGRRAAARSRRRPPRRRRPRGRSRRRGTRARRRAPFSSAGTTRLMASTGTAKPTPVLALPPPVRIWELTPITRPSPSSSGPPELPGLIAASVWTAPEIEKPFGAWIVRPSAEMMPVVTVPSSPNGLPIAIAGSPGRSSSDAPSWSGCSSPSTSLGSTLSSARSTDGSVPSSSRVDRLAVLAEAHAELVGAVDDVLVGDDRGPRRRSRSPSRTRPGRRPGTAARRGRSWPGRRPRRARRARRSRRRWPARCAARRGRRRAWRCRRWLGRRRRRRPRSRARRRRRRRRPRRR